MGIRKTAFSLLVLVIISSGLFSQGINNQVIVGYSQATDTNVKENVYHQVFFKNTKGEIFAILDINNYQSDFIFNCLNIDTNNIQYVIFTNYGLAAGVTKIIVIDIANKILYQTPLMAENYYPIVQSFDPHKMVLKFIVFDESNCGKLNDVKMGIETLKMTQVSELPRNFKTIHNLILNKIN